MEKEDQAQGVTGVGSHPFLQGVTSCKSGLGKCRLRHLYAELLHASSSHLQ